MRDDLGALLDELAPKPDGQQLLDGSEPAAKRPALTERARLWDLAIKLGRELGTEVDAHPGPAGGSAAAAAPPPRPRRRVDFG